MAGFKINSDLIARVAGRISYLNARHDVITNNVSNLETPNYKAKELEFQGYLEEVLNDPNKDIKAVMTPKVQQINAPGESKPNGNTVSLEDQMAKMADNSLEYMMATEILKKQMGLIKLSLQSGN